MAAGKWPFAGDSPVAIARKVAMAYRRVAQDAVGALAQADPSTAWPPGTPDPVVDLDRRCRQWGQLWIGETPVRDWGDNDMVSAVDGGNLIGLTAEAIGAARRRGRLVGRWDTTLHGYRYRVGDLWKLSQAPRTRGLAPRRSDS